MGDIAEMHLDGTLCECCGVFLGVSEGYPVRCSKCGADPSWHGAVIGKGELADYKGPNPDIWAEIREE
jgi:hypothetical protein